MSRIVYRGRDRWSSRGAPSHYRMPLVVNEGTRAWWWWFAALSIGFIASGALFVSSF